MLLLDAIAIVESGNRNRPGDHGAALSVFQIHEAAWQDVKRRFGNPREKPYLHIGDTFQSIGENSLAGHLRAQHCAEGQVALLKGQLAVFGVEQSPENVYACWNLGFHGFHKRHFNLAECPKTTLIKARRVAFLCAHIPDEKHQHD